jgi:hypothetical protein
MTEPNETASYTPTTQAEDYKSWPWFQDYLKYAEQEKAGILAAPKLDYGTRPTPVSLGLNIARWAMRTPEIRDIVWRRFVQGNYDNKLEEWLLSIAETYFRYKEGIQAGIGSLDAIIRTEHVLNGDVASVDDPEFRQLLLSHPAYYFDDASPKSPRKEE